MICIQLLAATFHRRSQISACRGRQRGGENNGFEQQLLQKKNIVLLQAADSGEQRGYSQEVLWSVSCRVTVFQSEPLDVTHFQLHPEWQH